jgi:hypothetical protein
MYFQKVIAKKLFVGVLKVTDEYSRIEFPSGSESGSIGPRYGSADPDP